MTRLKTPYPSSSVVQRRIRMNYWNGMMAFGWMMIILVCLGHAAICRKGVCGHGRWHRDWTCHCPTTGQWRLICLYPRLELNIIFGCFNKFFHSCDLLSQTRTKSWQARLSSLSRLRGNQDYILVHDWPLSAEKWRIGRVSRRRHVVERNSQDSHEPRIREVWRRWYIGIGVFMPISTIFL